MELKRIEFENVEGEGPSPKLITVTMTLEEAAWITQVTGKVCGGNVVTHGIYDCLASYVFNPYFEEGAQEIKTGAPLPEPFARV